MEHSFDVHIAKLYGVNSAILLKNIHFWIAKNKANNTNFYDGNYWTFNSKKAFAELFPYMNERQIDYALKKLIDSGLIVTGNYNKVAYDRTLWYAITKMGYSILQNCEMEETKLCNGANNIVEPIPDNKPSLKSDINTNIKYIVEYLNKTCNSAYKYTTQSTQKHIKARLNEGFTIEEFKVVIDKKYKEWKGSKMEIYLRPETLFGSKFESYLNQNEVKTGGNNKNGGSQKTDGSKYAQFS